MRDRALPPAGCFLSAGLLGGALLASALPNWEARAQPAAAPAAAAPAQLSSQPWRSVYKDRARGVEVFSREVQGSAVKELRAAGVLDVPAPQVMAVLADVTAHPGMLPPTESVELLKREGGQTFYHMVVKLGWVSRRDYCIRMEMSRDASGQGHLQWAQDNTLCPQPPKGVVRMRRNSGSWEVTSVALPGGGVGSRVVYQALIDPGGAIPAWIVNRASPSNLTEIFSSIRRAAALPRYASR